MALISQSELENRLGRELTTQEANDFDTQNLALQTYVEKWIGSSLEAVDETTRYYDAGSQHTMIDPATEITAVKYVNDDASSEYTFDTSDYTLEPRNSTLKTMIRSRNSKTQRGINNLSVTGKFSIAGDPNIVAMVKSAMLNALASGYRVSSTQDIKKESIEGYSVEYSDKSTDLPAETLQALQPIKYLFPGIL